MSHGRVALKQGLYTVNLDSRDATLNLDALYSGDNERFHEGVAACDCVGTPSLFP